MQNFEHPEYQDNQPNNHSNKRPNSASHKHPQNQHQIATIDEFSVARIYRLWGNWLGAEMNEGNGKLAFYRNIIAKTTGLENIRLATVYVLLARLDAQQTNTRLPAVEAKARPA